MKALSFEETIKNNSVRHLPVKILQRILVTFTMLAVATIISVSTAAAAPGINQQINFQGRLTNSQGVSVEDGTYSVTFSLYSTTSGGTAIWTENQSVTTKTGNFLVALGAVQSLSTVDFNQSNLYLAMKVGSDAEMSPRIPLNASPYAFNAQRVNGLSVTNNGGNTLNIASNKTLTVNDDITFGSYAANGGLLFANGSGQIMQTAAGAAGQCLKSAGSGSPTWDSCAAANTVTGTGTVGQLAIWNGTTTQTSDAGLYWDTVTKQLGIGTSSFTGNAALDVNGLIRVRNPFGETTAPTLTANGEFAFAQVSSNGRLYFRANDTDYFINNSGTGDYSEYFRKADPSDQLPVGSIISMDSGLVRQTLLGRKVIGVISAFGTRNNDSPAGDRHLDSRYANVGLLGQLPILVTSENGPISVGQKIGYPQSYAGYGTKAEENQPYMAVALQSFEPDNTACPAVTSLDSIPWPHPEPSTNPENLCFTLPSGTVIGRIQAYITPASDSGQSAETQALVTALGLNSDQTALTTTLDLTVDGTLKVKNGLVVGGQAEFQGPAIFQAMAEFIDTVIFRKQVTFNKDVVLKGPVWLNKDTAGLARIRPGQSKVEVTFSQPYQQTPIVSTSLNDTTVTTEMYQAYIESNLCDVSDGPSGCQTKLRQALLSQDMRYIITNQSNQGFTVELESPATQELTFSWIALLVQNED